MIARISLALLLATPAMAQDFSADSRAEPWNLYAEAPALTGTDPWFRQDPRVNAEFAKHGYFGRGLEVDAAALRALFP